MNLKNKYYQEKLILTVKCKFKDVDKLQKILMQKYNAIWPSMKYSINIHKPLNFNNESLSLKNNDFILLHIYENYYHGKKQNFTTIRYTESEDTFRDFINIQSCKKYLRIEKINRITHG